MSTNPEVQKWGYTGVYQCHDLKCHLEEQILPIQLFSSLTDDALLLLAGSKYKILTTLVRWTILV